jgi:hypothetical protein
MQLYHFLSEKWALEALKKQRIKVSRYEDLNDPFELLAMSLENKVSRKVMLETKSKINRALRILCCSKSWESPLLWGHYAEKHTGIALVLEVLDSSVQDITYAKDRASLDLHALMSRADEEAKFEMLEMYTTKYEQWSYEDEARIQFLENEVFSLGGHDFIKFDKDIKLVGFVLAPLNQTSRSQIENCLPQGHKLEIITTRIAFQSFDVVHQRKKLPYKLVGKS